MVVPVPQAALFSFCFVFTGWLRPRPAAQGWVGIGLGLHLLALLGRLVASVQAPFLFSFLLYDLRLLAAGGGSRE